MNGAAALAFSRMRYDDPQGDYGRQARQRLVLEAIVEKAKSNPTKLINAKFLNTVKTIQDWLNVPIDYYAIVNMGALEKIVNELDGIDVKSPLTFDYNPDTAHADPGNLYSFTEGSSTYTCTDTGELGRTYKGRTDSLMLVTVNPKQDKVTVMSLPRDSVIAPIGYEDQFPQKLNAAYELGSAKTTRKFKLVRNIILSVIAVLVLAVGVVAGTAYKNTKNAVDNAFQSAGVKKARDVSGVLADGKPFSILLLGYRFCAILRIIKIVINQY
ncbi:LCP family protein [Weissella confusa]|uniref:LCP family protein n=1 Tax=Weissella confusa TaxID=1583 RepID=A0A923NKN9_WEICO|nr:LCP family protein [Weissella confusa]